MMLIIKVYNNNDDDDHDEDRDETYFEINLIIQYIHNHIHHKHQVHYIFMPISSSSNTYMFIIYSSLSYM